MPPELPFAALKRKFYKLHENVSSTLLNKTNAPTTDTAEDASEPSAKRLRPATASADAIARPPSMVSTTSTIAATSSAEGSTAAGTPFGERPSVRFLATSFEAYKKAEPRRPKPAVSVENLPVHSPSSQEQFLLRLKTFADVRVWTPKPDAINEVQWARFGWSAVCDGESRDTVICGVCKERVVVRMTREDKKEQDENEKDQAQSWWHNDLEKGLVEKYKGFIKEGHEEGCLWRSTYCAEDIYGIRMNHPNFWQPVLRERYFSLTALEDALPENIVFPEYNGKDDRKIFDLEKLIKEMPEEVLQLRERLQQKEKENAPPADSSTNQNGDAEANAATEPTTPSPKKKKDPPPPVNVKAFALAICGWHGQSISGVNIAHCKHCFQRCGLWLYTSTPSSATTSGTSLLDPSSPMTFNPVDLHRAHCPWKNVRSQAEPGMFKGLAAWQVQCNLLQLWRPPVKWKSPYELLEESGDEVEIDEDELLKPVDWEEEERQQRERDTRLRKLKRMFTVKKTDRRLTKRKSRGDLGRKSGEGSRPGTGKTGMSRPGTEGGGE